MDADKAPRPSGIMEEMLSPLRELLEMDVVFVSEFVGDRLVFRAVEGEGESFGWHEGGSIPLEASYCKRVVDGRLNRTVPDAGSEDAIRDLPVTREADIGSYCAVPLVLSDGRPYGTLCCVSHAPDPWLGERDLALMDKMARDLVLRLERSGVLQDPEA